MTIIVENQSTLGAAPDTVGAAVPVGTQRIFKAVGVHNPTAGVVTFKAYLVPSGGTADSSNRVIDRTVGIGKTDLCPELIGRGLAAAGTLQMDAVACTAGFTAIDSQA